MRIIVVCVIGFLLTLAVINSCNVESQKACYQSACQTPDNP